MRCMYMSVIQFNAIRCNENVLVQWRCVNAMRCDPMQNNAVSAVQCTTVLFSSVLFTLYSFLSYFQNGVWFVCRISLKDVSSGQKYFLPPSFYDNAYLPGHNFPHLFHAISLEVSFFLQQDLWLWCSYVWYY